MTLDRAAFQTEMHWNTPFFLTVLLADDCWWLQAVSHDHPFPFKQALLER